MRVDKLEEVEKQWQAKETDLLGQVKQQKKRADEIAAKLKTTQAEVVRLKKLNESVTHSDSNDIKKEPAIVAPGKKRGSKNAVALPQTVNLSAFLFHKQSKG